MNPPKLEGIIVPIVTPFTRTETLDRSALRRLIRHVLGGGVHGILVSGSTGESYALSFEEKKTLLRWTVDEVEGRVPVFAGCGANSTRDVIRLATMSASAGADALTILTPFFLKPSPSEIVAHYTAAARATKLPLVMYNHPLRTGYNIEPVAVGRLLQNRSILGIKDSSGNMANTIEYLIATKPRADFSVMIGMDGMLLAGLAMGCRGAVAASANVAPRLLVDLYEAYRAGDLGRARALQFRLYPFRKAFALGTFPNLIKEALGQIGVPCGRCRAPAGVMSPAERAKVRSILQAMELGRHRA